MSGLGAPPFLAELVIPNAWDCGKILAPILGVVALRWLVLNCRDLLENLFPNWEWERQLGWLNLGAQRRAEAVLRWIGYVIYAGLVAALYGIVWATPSLATFGRWTDQAEMEEGLGKFSVLLVCLGIYLFYFGYELIPKIRAQHQDEELKDFQAKEREREKEVGVDPHLRRARHLPKSRVKTSPDSDSLN